MTGVQTCALPIWLFGIIFLTAVLALFCFPKKGGTEHKEYGVFIGMDREKGKFFLPAGKIFFLNRENISLSLKNVISITMK